MLVCIKKRKLTLVGVIVYKTVGNRKMEKRVNLRVEHVRHSKCRDDFIRRVKSNAAAKRAAKERGGTYETFFLTSRARRPEACARSAPR